MNRIFKIKVLKWNDHNTSRKKTYKKTMISNNFCEDAKVNAMPLACRWLFLGLLLRCGDAGQDTITITERQVNGLLTTRLGASNALSCLQSLQLVSFELTSNSIILKERNKERNKGIEYSNVVKPPLANSESLFDQHLPKNDPIANRKVKEEYFAAYFDRYKIKPIVSAKLNAAISNIVKRIGIEDATKVVRFYLQHQDSFYVKSTHSIGLCLRDCESLRVQMIKGIQITGAKIKQFENNQHYSEQIDRINRGEV